MKILLVNKFHYNRGGSESYYFGLDELLKIHGHEVIHFAMQDDKNVHSPTSEYFVTNVDFNNISGFKRKLKAAKNIFYSKEAYIKMKALLEKEHPDIVHLGLVHKQITYSILDAIKEYKIPVIQSVHDLIFVCPNGTMFINGHNCEKCVKGSKLNCIKQKCIKGSTAMSILSYMESKYIANKQYYNQINLFITECNFYKVLMEKGQITNSKIAYLPNFLQPSKFIVENTERGDYILYFGRFSEEKGIITLIEAYKKSKTNLPMILVGGGPEEDKIKYYVKTNLLDSKVTFAGYVYGEEMVSLLDKAKAVIVPSEWYENCPYSVIEAMARSRIIIASRIAGLPELVDDGNTGFLFKPHDSSDLAEKIKIVDNLSVGEIQTMNHSIYEKAKELFDSENYYTRLMIIYNKLLEEK